MNIRMNAVATRAVLIVDGDPTFGKRLAPRLSPLGVDVIVASDRADAEELCRRLGPAAAILSGWNPIGGDDELFASALRSLGRAGVVPNPTRRAQAARG